VLAYLKHPNIIRLNKVSISSDLPAWENHSTNDVVSSLLNTAPTRFVSPCLVMEMPFMDFDLSYGLRMGLVQAKHAESLSSQLMSAVKYLHSINIAHRAISPLSILGSCGSKGSIHFVLAGFTNAATPYGDPLLHQNIPEFLPGSLYSAPDVLAHTAAHRSISPDQWFAQDVWAVAVVVLETLAHVRQVFTPSALRFLSTLYMAKVDGTGTASTSPSEKMLACCPILRCLNGDLSFSGIDTGYFLSGCGRPALTKEQIDLIRKTIEPALCLSFEQRPRAWVPFPQGNFSEPVPDSLPGNAIDLKYLSVFMNEHVPRLV